MATDKSEGLTLLRCALDDDHANFRDGQWEAIDELVNNRSKLLVVQRTGWGKSSVYFISAKIFRNQGSGPTIIISPLLALMRNQIDNARRLGLNAATINSTNQEQWDEIFTQILEDRVDLLLISPERLANDSFVARVLTPISQRLGMLVVDEAHCISDWGHDFRPDYRRLTNILQRLPENVPVLGTTATANNRVIQDIHDQLGNIVIQRGPLTRSSLKLATLNLPSQTERLAWLADNLNKLDGTGIIYTLTTRDAEQVADWLRMSGISAQAYYGAVTAEGFDDANTYRQHLEGLLERNEIKALVATSALGMGYDKPDLSFVIHYQTPSSVVDYYQQVGRAGRQIDTALGLLMSGVEDADIAEHFRRTAFPKRDWVELILSVLAENDGLLTVQLQKLLNLRAGQISHVLKFLSVENPSPVFKDGSKWFRTAVAYTLDEEKIARLSLQREQEWNEIQDYLSHTGCRMEFLANSLDDPNPEPCGRCQNCNQMAEIDVPIAQETIRSAARYLRRSEFPLTCKKRVPKAALPTLGFSGNIPDRFRPLTGRVLSRWNDAGWGHVVAEYKLNGHFRGELVEAIAEMILNRWQPNPAPEWITSIPSLRNPSLVSDFCDQLAIRLGIPHRPVLSKVIDNPPQKLQQNGYHQCNNLDGVFAVEQGLPNSPVLLIDDVVDSAWTMTIGAALLRTAGSGPVWPVALTSSSAGG